MGKPSDAMMDSRAQSPYGAFRVPAGWTYLGLRGNRKGQAIPHYRTAPGVIRTVTPGGREVYIGVFRGWKAERDAELACPSVFERIAQQDHSGDRARVQEWGANPIT